MANNKPKTDYKSVILAYLKNNIGNDVSRTELIENTGISKSRLTEILQSIKDDGYDIVTPPRSGKIRLEINNKIDILPVIKDSDIRQWLILFILSIYEKLTFNEILLKTLYLMDPIYVQNKVLIDSDTDKKYYDDNHLIKTIRKNLSLKNDEETLVAKEIISVTSVRKDLKTLREQGLVKMEQKEHTLYSLTEAAPMIVPLSSDSLYDLCNRYEETSTSTSSLKPLRQAIQKVQKLANYEGEDLRKSSFGKTNEISPEKMASFDAFLKLPYKRNLIEIEDTYKDNITGEIQPHTYKFAVGLLYYSVETNSFYALGKNITDSATINKRIDWIRKATPLNETNHYFHNESFYKIYEEMFSSNPDLRQDSAYHVKVLFQDKFQIYKRFDELAAVRRTAIIRPINNRPEDCEYDYIYEDDIRGLTDFARYLRSFGYSVLALEPPELQNKMLFTYNNIIHRYGEEVDE